MKKYTYLLGAAVLGLSAVPSFADITTIATLDNSFVDPALVSAGWVGYKITLHADGVSSTGVSGFDVINAGNPALGLPQTNLGIRGNIQQEWGVKKNTSTTVPTPDSAGVVIGTTAVGGLDGLDSYFIKDSAGGYFNSPGLLNGGWGTPPVEDNNLANGTGTFNASPITDVSSVNQVGKNYGVGSIMTAAAAFASLQQDVDIAYIIVPSTLPTTIRGFALDQVNPTTQQPHGAYAIDLTLNPVSDVPEPASLGLLALGGLGLLARRRR